MVKKLAVAIIHGMGNQTEEFAEEMITLIRKKFARKLEHLVDDPSPYLIIQPIQWATVFAERQQKLFEKTVLNNNLDYQELRRFILHYLGDSIAYQPVETAKHNYDRVHDKIRENLKMLSEKAGDYAPLCVISHSLGSVITCNYFYDLQFKQNEVTAVVGELSALEKGDTLTLFYTLGTSLPLWSLRYHNFDRPIYIPPSSIQDFYPGLQGEWINFYDKDDILAYPLRDLSEYYKNSVSEDREVNIGNFLTSWNPFCHSGYFTDSDVIDPIVDGLVRTWRYANDI